MMVRQPLAFGCLALAIGGLFEAKLPPVDEARRDPAVQALSRRVIAAARREDLPGLLALTAEPFRFGEDELTHDAVAARIAGLPGPARAVFWQQLRDAVTLGMAYDREYDEPILVAPYVSVLLAPLLAKDPEAMVITGTRVAVHQTADTASPIIGRLDYDIVTRGPDGTKPAPPGAFGGTYEWVHIQMPDSRVGWVASKYVHGVGEAAFAFGKIQGVWKLIAYGMKD